MIFLLASLALFTTEDRCRASTTAPTAAEVIQRAISTVGLDRVAGKVRISPATDVISMDFQSDRMYPPYLRRTVNLTLASDYERGVQRSEMAFGANATLSYVTDSARRAMYSPRGSQLVPLRGPNAADERALDPWMVLADWHTAANAKVIGECYYRDYWRAVVSRKTADGEERLYVDAKTGFPVKLDRRERDILWGDVHAEYLWSIWKPAGEAVAPEFAYRIVEGEANLERRVTSYTMQPRDSAGRLDIASDAAAIPQRTTPPPDTVRVSANTFALVTQAYTNVVTLQRDTIFILDAQTSAERAHQDSVWIGKLFPGKHPIVLVVTDLAWPHISGVRYWVALGVPVVSHRISREFLTKVVAHKWTLEPDLLEKRRASVKLKFQPVDDSFELGGGAVRLRAIDGIGSEGAVMAYIPSDRFLYAGDYIQPGGPGSFSAIYAREVRSAVQRAGFTPERFIAMHMKLGAWPDVERIAQRGDN